MESEQQKQAPLVQPNVNVPVLNIPHYQGPNTYIPQKPVPIIQKIEVPKKFILLIIFSIILTAAAVVGIMLVIDVLGRTYVFDNTVNSNIVYRDIEGERDAGVVLPTTDEVVASVINSVVEIYGTAYNELNQLVSAAGSGVITHYADEIGTTGVYRQIFITTNNHVVDGVSNMWIRTHTGRVFSGTQIAVVGGSPANDIAVIWVYDQHGPGFSADYIASWRGNPILHGEDIIAIGNPTSFLPYTVTKGIVSYAGVREISVNGKIIEAFQFDASINGGNSGGPVFDSKGLLVGIVGFKAYANGTQNKDIIEGLAFAIHGSTALSVGNTLINRWNSSAERSYIEGEFALGATFVDKVFADKIDEVTTINRPYVQVATIQTSSDAFLCGLRKNHIIRRLIIGGTTHDITSQFQFLTLLNDAKASGDIDISDPTKNKIQLVTQNDYAYAIDATNSSTRTIILTQYRLNA